MGICRDKGKNFKGHRVILVKELEVTLKGVKMTWMWTATEEMSWKKILKGDLQPERWKERKYEVLEISRMWLYEYGAVTLSWVGEKMWGSRSLVFDWTVGMFFLLGDHSLSPLRGALNHGTGDHLCLQWGDRGLCLLRLLVPCWFWCCMDFSAGLRFYPML